MQEWLDKVEFVLPDDFDFDVIRSRDDVAALFTIPNGHRGIAARALYERRDRIGHELVYAAIMYAWEHDYCELIDAFESVSGFPCFGLATSLSKVAPKIKRKRRLRVWRGIAVREADPSEAAIGFSWTRSRDVACWFATTYPNRADLPGSRPFVFTTMLDPYMILATHDGRGEQEVLVDPLRLEEDAITVDGTTTRLWELEDDSTAPVGALADWRVDAQKLVPVFAREIGDGNELAFLPQKPIRKTRNIGHVDAAAYYAAALLHRRERRRH